MIRPKAGTISTSVVKSKSRVELHDLVKSSLLMPLVLDHGHHFSSETRPLQESQDDRVAISLSSEPDEMGSTHLLYFRRAHLSELEHLLRLLHSMSQVQEVLTDLISPSEHDSEKSLLLMQVEMLYGLLHSHEPQLLVLLVVHRTMSQNLVLDESDSIAHRYLTQERV